MTALAGRRDAHVDMVTSAEAIGEIKRLLKSVGMNRNELERRGDAWDLDADQGCARRHPGA